MPAETCISLDEFLHDFPNNYPGVNGQSHGTA